VQAKGKRKKIFTTEFAENAERKKLEHRGIEGLKGPQIEHAGDYLDK